MTQRIESTKAIRKRLIGELSERLTRQENPRLAMSLVLLGASTCAFLASTGLLYLGIETMAIRYAIAACIGYIAFLVGIQIWLARKLQGPQPERSQWFDSLEPDIGRSSSDKSDAAVPFERGSDIGLDNLGDFGDGDDGLVVLIPIVVIVALIVGVFGAFAMLAAAPSLLGEVLLDGLIAGVAYRHLRHLDRQHWVYGVVRKSWKQFVAIVVVLVIAGIVIQSLAPSVQSIGDIWR